MSPARPEFEVCRICGYDIADITDDYLICPECGSPNNRILAAKPLPPHERMGARALLMALLAAVMTFVLLLPAAAISDRVPWFPFVLLGAVLTIVIAVRVQTSHRWRAWEKPKMAMLAAMLMVAGIMAVVGIIIAARALAGAPPVAPGPAVATPPTPIPPPPDGTIPSPVP